MKGCLGFFVSAFLWIVFWGSCIGIGEQFKIINNINYTKDEYDRSKIFRKTLINKYHPDKGGKTGDIDLINKIFENVNCVEEYK